MKKDFKKEILKYTSAATAVLAGTSATAQYQYTDIKDTTISSNNGFYNLDINQDGVIDFKITQYVDTGGLGTTNAVIIQPYGANDNAVAGEKISIYNYPFNLNAAVVLDGTTDWRGAGGNYNNGYLTFVVDGQNYPNSNWVGPETDGFLGLKIYVNSLPHYGWARLDIGADSKSFTVKDFSVNLSVDSSIVVGSELIGQVENLLEHVKIGVTENGIKFFKPNSIENLQIKIFDLTGRLLKEEAISEEVSELFFQKEATALYIVELESEGVTRREKVFVY